MKTPEKDRVAIRIFLGYSLSPDLKIQLERSSVWKLAKIVKHQNSDILQFIHFHEKEYVGKYFNYSIVTMNDIKNLAKDIKDQLKIYTPNFPADDLELHVFPQVFIS